MSKARCLTHRDTELRKAEFLEAPFLGEFDNPAFSSRRCAALHCAPKDLFALGVVLYILLTKSASFQIMGAPACR